MPSKLKKAIGAVKDRTSISLAKVSNYNASNLDVVVLKATSHENVPMEERYVQEILRLVSSNKAYAAGCARAIGKRISRTRNWIVALKSLFLVLRLFQDGDPYFPREVLHATKRGSKILNLSSFRDDSNNTSPWDFTAFVRTFALYLDVRLDCFLTGKLQRRFTSHGGGGGGGRKENHEYIRDMKPTILLDKLPHWQRLLERAIATKPTGAAKANQFLQSCLYAIVQESFELYKDISEGISTLLDSFFHLHYNNCVLAYKICVKSKKQLEELSDLYLLCSSLGVGLPHEYPHVRTISLEIMESLQEFLKDQESSFSPAPPLPHKNTNQNNDYNKVKSQTPPVLLLPGPPTGPNNSRARARARAHSHSHSRSRSRAPILSARQDSYGSQSDFSFATTTTTTDGYSERASEVASSHCTSLEDLISATEVSKLTAPSISIDLEAYPEQFEEHAGAGTNSTGNRLSDSYSTQSLPVSISLDHLSLDDDCALESDLETIVNRQPPPPRLPPAAGLHGETKEDKLESSNSSVQGWELVLLEEHAPNVKANIGAPADSTSFLDWEQDLEAPTMPSPSSNSQSSITKDDLFHSDLSVSPSSSHHYNPFLHDTIELPPTTTTSSTNPTPINFQLESQHNPNDSLATTPTFEVSFPSPTFHATPTFSSQSSSGKITTPAATENDPFALASYNDRQLYTNSVKQQDLLHEQQLWFANQNKIIAKRMV